jgi:hypothetical protein
MKFDELYFKLLENFNNLDDIDFDFTMSIADSAMQNIFAAMWANWMETEVPKNHDEYVNLSQNDILEIAPKYDSFLSKIEQQRLEDWTYDALTKFEEANGGADIKQLYIKALEADGQSLDDYDERYSSEETFILLVIMKMMGQGVSWEDNHESPNFRYPHVDISYLQFPSFKEFEKEEDIDEEPEDWEFSGEEWKDGFNPKTSGEEWKNIDDD